MSKYILITILFVCANIAINAQVFFQSSFGPKIVSGSSADQVLYNYKSSIGFTLNAGYVVDDGTMFSIFYDYSSFKSNGNQKVDINPNKSHVNYIYTDINPISLNSFGFSGETNLYSYDMFDLFLAYGGGLSFVKREAINYQNSTTPVLTYEEWKNMGYCIYGGAGITANLSDKFAIFTEFDYAYSQFSDDNGNSKNINFFPLKFGIKYFTNISFK